MDTEAETIQEAIHYINRNHPQSGYQIGESEIWNDPNRTGANHKGEERYYGSPRKVYKDPLRKTRRGKGY